MNGTIQLKSSGFSDMQPIPVRYTGDGEEISPPLSWSGVSHDAKSLVLVVEDPVLPFMTVTHWLLWNIPPEMKGFSEGMAEGINPLPETSIFQGKNVYGKHVYCGPKPPWGRHQYIFTLYALDCTLEILPSISRKKLLESIKPHVIQKGTLTGVFR